MVITTEVEVKLVGTSVKRYESLGYIIPRAKNSIGKMTIEKGAKIKVKVEDLSVGSHTLVFVKCDCKDCTTPIIKPIKWQDYLKGVKDDGNYYCNKCSLYLFGTKKAMKTKLSKSISFYAWCLEHNFEEVINRWDLELNNGIKPSEISFKTKKKYWFKCPKGIHNSELQTIVGFTDGQIGSINCNACNSFGQWGIENICEDFLEKYWDYNLNDIDPFSISYGSSKKVWVKCLKIDYHGSSNIECKSFVSGTRCSYCGNHKVHPMESLGILFPEVLNIWSDKNNKTPYEYTHHSGQEVWWKCPDGKHEDYFRSVCHSNIQGFRCPLCVRERKESILQEKVRRYLETFNCKILHEYGCTIECINPKTRHILPYDNEIKDYKLIIEVNGSQHYKENSGTWFSKNFDLHKIQLHDRYKRLYARSCTYNYLEIPYWTDNKKEEYKKLIDDKILEIQQLNNIS